MVAAAMAADWAVVALEAILIVAHSRRNRCQTRSRQARRTAPVANSSLRPDRLRCLLSLRRCQGTTRPVQAHAQAAVPSVQSLGNWMDGPLDGAPGSLATTGPNKCACNPQRKNNASGTVSPQCVRHDEKAITGVRTHLPPGPVLLWRAIHPTTHKFPGVLCDKGCSSSQGSVCRG